MFVCGSNCACPLRYTLVFICDDVSTTLSALRMSACRDVLLLCSYAYGILIFRTSKPQLAQQFVLLKSSVTIFHGYFWILTTSVLFTSVIVNQNTPDIFLSPDSMEVLIRSLK